ncbi:MAG: hypothetical protein BSOLF_0682 [Candidatus Carbobacillus altaicus]|uniref:Uncharacterized protein n=1 Tax=Candidatus Carbonibacillus altaicus TaxID=2163959 RepID=A0A2R6Y568_9BACL|nr:MAG: hypothetical protein BSOLF_0682 [Candidatus Carbobacillus altaicus]
MLLYGSFALFLLFLFWGGAIVATLNAAWGEGGSLEKALRASGFLAWTYSSDAISPGTQGEREVDHTELAVHATRWTRHDSRFGFSIALPEGWVFQDLMGEEKNGIEVDWTAFAHDPKGRVTLLVQRLKTDDLKGWVDQGVLLSPGIEAVQFEPYAQGKDKGYRLRYRQRDPEGHDSDARELYLELNKHTYVRLAMFAPAGELQETLFEEIVSRFQLLKL